MRKSNSINKKKFKINDEVSDDDDNNDNDNSRETEKHEEQDVVDELELDKIDSKSFI
jgi:hypothetical protein